MADPDYEPNKGGEAWINITLAQRMTERKDSMRLTIAELAEKTNIPMPTLKRILCGNVTVPVERFNRLCDVLNLCE